MNNLKSLNLFKDFAKRVHTSYALTNQSLELLGEKIPLSDGYKDTDYYEILDDESGQVISAMPNFFITQGLKKDGPISQVVAHGMLSWVYFAWERRFRPLIAKELGVHNDEVMSDIMGDIRILRHKIAHNLGFLDEDIKKLKILNWLKQGHIILKTSDMNKIQLIINEMSISISSNRTSVDKFDS